MTPADLRLEDFVHYPPESRAFAASHLTLLRRLPAAICPSVVQQIRDIPTSFPQERISLERQCDALQRMPDADFATLVAPLEELRLPNHLLQRDWVGDPASFVTELAAYLWSSGQISQFREGTEAVFASFLALGEDRAKAQDRLVISVAGQGARPPVRPFGKLRKHGILLSQLQEQSPSEALLNLAKARAQKEPEAYAHWYVDGGSPWTLGERSGIAHTSYVALSRLRARVLDHMKNTIISSDAGAEAMHDRLASLTPEDLRTSEITSDPVLQRFYTELFTLSSGPQIFSTSFVQWTGRELIRRASPRTLLLRYSPRQRHRSFDDMVQDLETEKVLDPEGSLRDAEMGSYYSWLEARRMAPSGKLIFLCWLEGTSNLFLIARNAPAGAESRSKMTLTEALNSFT